MTHVTPTAWLVVTGDGAHRSVYLERARADQWASRCHGTVYPLYLWPESVA
jgi:hypothetical protein